jgi:phage tail sheath gpL-like
MALPLLAALGCDPCPHNKCLGPPALTVHVIAADTGASLVSPQDDAGAGGQATAALLQNGVTRQIGHGNPLAGADTLSTGVAAGQATVTASAPGYVQAQLELTFAETQCGGVIRREVTFTLAPEHAASTTAPLVATGGSTICGETP